MKSNWSRRLFGCVQRSYGAHIEMRLRELETTQWYSRDKLRELQWTRLTSLIRHAYANVPYYRRTWREAGIHPSDIRSRDDFYKLPPLSKRQVQEHYDELLAQGLKRVPLYYGSTSGSSGTPTRFILTQDAKARFWAAQYRGYGWFGISPGDKQGRFFGMPFDQVNSSKERAKDWIMNRRRISVFDLTEEKMKAFAHKMNHFQPVYFNGYASWLVRFAEFISLEKRRSRYPWIPLKAVVTTSEVLTPTDQALIEEALECPVINEYGAAEIGLVAITCQKGGFHTVPENIYLETMPLAVNVPSLHNSSQGPVEIVVTNLHNYAMPLIRYRVGDLLTSAPDETNMCDCGRSSQLIDPIIGRTNSYVVTPEGKVLGGFFFKYLADWSLKRGGGIRQFVVKQEAVDRITFYIVKVKNLPDNTLKFLLNTTQTHLGPSVTIEVKFVDALPRTATGKLMNFSSTLNVNEVLAQIRESKRQ